MQINSLVQLIDLLCKSIDWFLHMMVVLTFNELMCRLIWKLFLPKQIGYIIISKIMHRGYLDEEKLINDWKVEQNRPEYRTFPYTGNNFVIAAINIFYFYWSFQTFTFNLAIIKLLRMQSKALDRSIKTALTIKFLSNLFLHSSNKRIRTCWVL